MAYICDKPRGYCYKCPHYRKDEDDPDRMVYCATVDKKKEIDSYTDATVQHLIDANHLICVLEAGDDRNIISTIMNQPVIEQRVHAFWEKTTVRVLDGYDEVGEAWYRKEPRVKCSHCGRIEKKKWNFCRCGAQMDLEPNSHR